MRVRARTPHRGPSSGPEPLRQRSRGQSVVEFALVLPILVFMLLGILDFGRVFTSLLTVESAAREAADFGAYSWHNWQTEPTDNRAITLAAMEERACVASRNLTGYEGPDTDCQNPKFSAALVDADGKPASKCDDPDRATPCRVKVDLEYTFDIILPIGFDFLGTRLGLPQEVVFTRSSIFAVSSFQIDET